MTSDEASGQTVYNQEISLPYRQSYEYNAFNNMTAGRKVSGLRFCDIDQHSAFSIQHSAVRNPQSEASSQ